jgi:hypothetical protein
MNIKSILIFTSLFALLLGGAGFYVGYISSKNKTEQKFIQNYESVKNIAELGSLEVRGVSKSETKSNTEDNTIVDVFEKTFFEKMKKIEIPYVAKYGVSMNNQDVAVRENTKDNSIQIVLPMVQLLSYELRLDQSDASSKRGLLIFENDDDFIRASRKLYAENRKMLETNPEFIKKSEEQLVKLMQNYFAPTGKHVEVKFENRPKRD